MPVPKGHRYGGRKKGTPNKATVEKQQIIKQLCPDGDDPLTFWMQLLKDKSTPLEIRMMAARDVAPYRHPKLASIEARTGGKTHEQRLEELNRMTEDDE
jgi:hypothetical protein